MSEKETPAPKRAGGSFLRAVIYKARSNAAEISPPKKHFIHSPEKVKNTADIFRIRRNG